MTIPPPGRRMSRDEAKRYALSAYPRTMEALARTRGGPRYTVRLEAIGSTMTIPTPSLLVAYRLILHRIELGFDDAYIRDWSTGKVMFWVRDGQRIEPVKRAWSKYF